MCARAHVCVRACARARVRVCVCEGNRRQETFSNLYYNLFCIHWFHSKIWETQMISCTSQVSGLLTHQNR
jgi:hypothetical protein